MKKVIRNIVISFVLVAMCTINIPSVLYADDTAVMAETDENDFVFDQTLQKISGYNGASLDVIIPDKIKGLDVLIIGAGAFMRSGLTSVSIPDTVKEIHTNAFQTNPDLKNIVLPLDLTTIGPFAFEGCGLVSVDFKRAKQLTLIDNSAFENNKLNSVEFPDSLRTISDKAFRTRHISPDKIKSVTFNHGLESIGKFCFEYQGITDLVFPDSVKHVLDYSFHWNLIENIVFSKQMTTVSPSAFASNKLETLVIPDTVTKIESMGFGYNLIKDLTISKNVEIIGNLAFMTNQLEEVIIPANVKEIRSQAFNVNKLKKVVFNEGLEIIQVLAFATNNLTNLNLPSTVKEIGGGVMDGQTATGYYKKVGDKWEFDFVDLDPEFFAGGFDPTSNIMLDGKTVTKDQNHIIQFDTEPVGKTITYEYQPYNPSDTSIKGTVDKTVTLNLEPYVEKYTVTFDAQGGTPITNSMIIPEGENYGTLPTATREGYDFDGWYTDKKGEGVKILTGDRFTINEDQVLYANWIAKEWIVNFDTDEADKEIPNQTIITDGLVKEPAFLTKKGFTFGGWYKDSELTKSFDFDKDFIKGHTTIYAKWVPQEWIVNFETNGANEAIGDQVIKTNEYASKPIIELTKDGYSFIGWFKDINLTEPFDFTKNAIVADTKIFAKWVIKEWTVSFDTNGANDVISNKICKNGNLLIKPTDPSKNWFTFSGWFKDKALTIPFNFATDKVNSDMMLYAKWIPVLSDVSPVPPTSDNSSAPDKSASVKDSNSVNTNDETKGALYVITLIVAGMAIIKLARRKNKTI